MASGHNHVHHLQNRSGLVCADRAGAVAWSSSSGANRDSWQTRAHASPDPPGIQSTSPRAKLRFPLLAMASSAANIGLCVCSRSWVAKLDRPARPDPLKGVRAWSAGRPSSLDRGPGRRLLSANGQRERLTGAVWASACSIFCSFGLARRGGRCTAQAWRAGAESSGQTKATDWDPLAQR